MEMSMKKVLGIILHMMMLLPLIGADSSMPKYSAVTVYMSGVIEPQDLSIIILNENGDELESDAALISFEFPNLEEWEVSQTLYFQYSSRLLKQRSGKLIFRVEDLALDEVNVLKTDLELVSENRMTTIENGNTFNTVFLPGVQQNVPIGKLVVKIRKRSADVFSTGVYKGTFTIDYTEGS